MLGLALSLSLGCGDVGANEASSETEKPVDPGACLLGEDVPDGLAPRCHALSALISSEVDILFVIDTGPEGGPWQARLASALSGLTERLEAIEHRPDLRIGFTTAHDGNPWCAAGPDEPGLLQLSSCTERPDAFVDAQGGDRFDEWCSSQCSLPALPADPFLEVGRELNFSLDADLGEALACASLMGTRGCRFAAPLRGAGGVAERRHEFFRESARPVIVLLTGGVDCSITEEGADAFDPEGRRDLWPDESVQVAPPAVCFAAGTTCSENIDGTLDCVPENIAIDGYPTPLDRELLRTVNSLGKDIRDAGTGSLVVVAGVQPGFAPGDEVIYRAPGDEATANTYGIEPSCRVDGSAALPPVRLARLRSSEELAGSLTGWDAQLSSVCDDDYDTVVDAIVEAVAEEARPPCFPGCAADTDPARTGVQAQCRVELYTKTESGDMGDIWVPRCDPAVEDPQGIPVGALACWVPRTGLSLSPQCAEQGLNLEIEVRSSRPLPPGTQIRPTCYVSDDRERDCPGW